eukprot:CAMPEP_0178924974 /NCGR_PEP_ID=MMETSP0786-20121207/17636_1 /TAXON_ID=186022 /ORGANISM="Thalassionema frauenfeldii, Strain CCMP 1798" /LENGTH=441 /DNA_ID=CAMNT_0020599767 /DNA_START=157 /DNA_END=1479 /DNA_ORIENTATION=+
MSAFSFSSFCAKPFVGRLSDVYGFRLPYKLSLGISCLGGFLYLTAAAFGEHAVTVVLISRLLGGVGAASSALGFAYLAKVIPHDKQTQTNTVLSMTRILGMTTGPALNMFLANVDTVWFGLPINSLNSAGLVLIITNTLALCSIFFLLDEPEVDLSAPDENETSSSLSPCAFLCAAIKLDIILPIFAIFAFNASYQLIETGLAPAASHALRWTPVELSFVMGGMSVVVFMMMVVVYSLSSRKVKDDAILLVGCVLSTIGYYLIWDLWRWQSSFWHFLVPIFLSTAGYPFLASPTRSLFTKAVDQSEILKNHQGSMQAVLSMFASVAGFVTPGVVAVYILQPPDAVELDSHHQRELSPVALFSPIMMLIVLVGNTLLFATKNKKESIATNANSELMNESTELLVESQQSPATPSSSSSLPRRMPRRFSSKVQVHRRNSTCMM